MYGDVLEKTNSGLGNGSISLATDLGSILIGGTISLGKDAAGADQAIAETQTDFVSIANSEDADYFSFSISGPAALDILLTPRGGVFSQGVEGSAQSTFDANARNDLSLAVFASDGTTLLGVADNTLAGGLESLAELNLSSAGEYFVRVMGASDSVQLYELGLSLAPSANQLTGDYDFDSDVDGTDFLLWQRSVGLTGAGLTADGNGDGVIDSADLAIWEENYGTTGTLGSFRSIPEPQPLLLCFWTIVILLAFDTHLPKE